MKKARIANRQPVRTSTSPIRVPTTVRNHDITVLTSLPAGKMVPLAAIPLLREDSARTRVSMAFQMMETVELLVNPINVSVKAYLVPHLAFERFTGMDDLNRAWEGKPPRDGLPVTPFIERMPAKAHGADQIMKYLGKHALPASMISTAYHEAYNAIWNFRATNRSPDIAKRARLLDTLAPAFWTHQRFAHIVPDWDQAVMDGEVALNTVAARLPVTGIGFEGGSGQVAGSFTSRRRTGLADGVTNTPGETGYRIKGSTEAVGAGLSNLIVKTALHGGQAYPDVWAEMQTNGITVSLSNIDLARKTQAFAKLREQFSGHDDDYIIDMLMDGLSVPEQNWKQPMLLQERTTVFGMSKRYATNGEDLTQSVVNGATMIDMNFVAPKCPVGGVIMIVAEVVPDQLFERGRDPYLFASSPADFPHALRDLLDPEPVEAVRNDYIDIDHDAAAATFGYAPLNHAWNFASPCVGGRFYRPTVDAAFDEDRQRIWAVETQNPVLSEDFYLVKSIHTKPFVNPNQDPFEATCIGSASITGLTQFGPVLIESNGNYDKVMAEAPKERIPKP